MARSEAPRIVVYRDGDTWIAQCLEHDIAAQAHDLRELQHRMSVALEAERQETLTRFGEEFSGIDPAPQEFFDMYEECTGTYTPRGEDQYELAMCA